MHQADLDMGAANLLIVVESELHYLRCEKKKKKRFLFNKTAPNKQSRLNELRRLGTPCQ